jgi:hypothetical protein
MTIDHHWPESHDGAEPVRANRRDLVGIANQADQRVRNHQNALSVSSICVRLC